MIWKLLLTLLVILGAVLVIRRRGQARLAPPLPAPQLEAPRRRIVMFTATAVVALMIVGLGGYAYFYWQDANQVVNVRVIDSRTGNSVTYKAYKGDVEGRSFTTTEGRTVTLAEVECLELGGD
ncbi:hypothetical protein [Solemya velesiana gill symbiont]|uniref:Antitermination protein NusG n=1 Tax=Solemya velesiana gill symbiont TaxID=1918948 RepID=A0A1T2KY08_9GAMM|nr:hypothetical protein [Solemya velesiana gill symbiont]OOZ37738.1 hypothetical protein BOW51_00980 [Solemya velesiana gill symbiont]